MNCLRGLTVCLLLLAVINASAVAVPSYYGEDFYQQIKSGIKDQSLAHYLNEILDKSHHAIGYGQARIFLLANYHLIEYGNRYAVKDVYCEKEYAAPGPNSVPNNEVINVEHTWPQSKFTANYSKESQKSDLHHLYPTDSEMNSTRGNYPFGEVATDKKILKCEVSRFGASRLNGEIVFEPPTAHRGNVARALFYFSVRYQATIDKNQETFLRKWHQEDPVDEEEMDRNEAIFETQGSRNPFIDHPGLVSKISDF